MYIFENHYLSFNGSNECKFVFHIIEWKWSKVENLKKEAMPDLKLSQSFWEKNWIDNLEVYRCIPGTHFIFFECLGAKINPSDFLKRKINLWSTHALLIDMMHFFPKKNET